MRSHNVTCHLTQANTPRLNPSQRRLVLGCSKWNLNLSSVFGANVMPRMASNAGSGGMTVVSRAVYAVPDGLSWTLAATIIREEQRPPDSVPAARHWSSATATELTLSRSIRVGLTDTQSDRTHHTQLVCVEQLTEWEIFKWRRVCTEIF